MGFLNENGLSRLLSKIKSYVERKITATAITIVPEDQVSIVPSTGDSTSAVMSQKAVTDELSLKADAADVYDKEAVDALGTRCGDVEDEFDDSDLTVGKNWALTGNDAPSSMSTFSGWGCLPAIAVSKGDLVTIATKGGTTARAWALTDSSRAIVVRATAGTDTTSSPVTLEVENDGFLYVNCNSDSYESFSVTHRYSSLAVRIGECEAAEETLDGRVDDIETIGLGIKRFDTDDLDDGGEGKGLYWALSGSYVKASPTKHGDAHHWTCLPRIAVNKGDKVTISTIGGKTARAWALTDMARKILAVADEDTDTTASPITLSVENVGWLYINCSVTSNPNFFVNIFPSYNDAINSLREEVQQMLATAHYKNNPLPTWKDSLKVLAIGNSYTQDALSYLHAFRAAAGIPTSKICFYGVIASAYTLENWAGIYDAGDPLEEHTNPKPSCSNYTTQNTSDPYFNPMNLSDSNTLAEIFAKDWDVIVFQQYSNYANSYASFNPYLTYLMRRAREHCTNPKVVFAWQSVWAWKGDHDASYPESVTRWREICAATQEMVRRDGIDIVIPTGTAIQNARNTATFVNHNGEMTRDGTHLAYGAGRYIATATWWQTLIAPVLGVGVLGNTAVHETAEDTKIYDFIAVDANNRELCQRCALAACVDMWNITDDIDPIPAPES